MNDLQKTRYLQYKNRLPYDEMITFIEEGHVYNVHSEYFGKILNKYDGGSSLPLKSVTETVGQYFYSGFDNYALKIWNNVENRLKMVNDPTFKYYGCQSPDDIRKIWNQAAEAGTKMHAHFEDLANLYEHKKDHPEDVAFHNYVEEQMKNYKEYKFFVKFCKDFGFDSGKRKFFRTEFCMFHPELHISGMIDGLVYNVEKNGYEIIDYKRCKGGVKRPPKNPRKPVEELAPNSRGQILPSLEKVRNMSIVKYGIQLSLYRYMFERMYPGKKIVGLYLIVVDSTKLDRNDGMEIIEIPLEQHNQNILEIFQHRATDILLECGEDIPDELYKELVEILPPMPMEEE
jgi:hypothetical protein